MLRSGNKSAVQPVDAAFDANSTQRESFAPPPAHATSPQAMKAAMLNRYTAVNNGTASSCIP